MSFIFLRYLIAGGTAALGHFGILILLVETISVDPTLATTVGFIVAIFINYTLQYYWTFTAMGQHRVLFARYVAVTCIMLIVNTFLFWLFYKFIGLSYIVAQLAATCLVLVANYTINQNYTFAKVDI